MVYYKPVKVSINTLRLAEVILDIVVWYYGLFDLIISEKDSLFTSKFWSSLYYFLDIKKQLSIVFYSQTDG